MTDTDDDWDEDEEGEVVDQDVLDDDVTADSDVPPERDRTGIVPLKVPIVIDDVPDTQPVFNGS